MTTETLLTAKSSESNPVTEEDPKTRSRVSKACTRCRTRKDRCDGERPFCTACRNAGKVCTYDTVSKKRGLPEGYVRGLEKLIAFATHGIPGLEDALVDLLHNEDLRRQWNDPSADDYHVQHWKESRIQRELEALLSAQAHPNLKRKRNAEDENLPNIQELIATQLSLKITTAVAEDGDDLRHSRQVLELPMDARALLDQYFIYVHCWFPVLQRPQVLKLYYGRATMSPASTALLWAILAYTISFRDHNGASQDTNSLSLLYRGQALQACQRNLESIQEQTALMTCAQSFLLIALLDFGSARFQPAWAYLGVAIRLGSLIAAADADSEARRSFNQGAFILDTLLSQHLGTTPLLKASDIDSHKLATEDGHEEWEPWHAGARPESNDPSFSLSVFNRTTRIMRVLANARSDQPEYTDFVSIQLSLEMLHNARSNDAVTSLAAPTAASPPHHVFFQILHLMVQLHLVAAPVEIGILPIDRARLASNLVGLLNICSDSAFFDLRHIPPILSGVINLAREQARVAARSFGAGLPSYTEFLAALREHQLRLSSTWPIFAEGLDDGPMYTPDLATMSTDAAIEAAQTECEVPQNATKPAQPAKIASLAQDSQSALFPSLRQIPNLGHGMTTARTLQTPDNGIIGPPTPRHQSNASPQSLRHSVTAATADNVYGATPQRHGSFEGPFHNMYSTPSYQGDEVDNIFNEMAYLDTHEWHNERAMGLRNFGFSDEMAFQAFCNDPERLNMPAAADQLGLSSSKGSWTFTTDQLNGAQSGSAPVFEHHF